MVDRPVVLDGARSDEPTDPRVAAVLEVLAGASVASVAARWNVEPALLHRWVRAFVAAGTAQVTNRPAADAAQQRDRFLVAFAHEVRTPLSVALGWLALLVDGDVPEHEVASSVLRLHAALSRLAERTIDVELMATASLGRLSTSPKQVPIADLVAGIEPAPEIRGDAGAELYADPAQFRRVLRDLWDAAALSPAPPHRWLDVRRVEPWVEIRVVRSGEPIDPQVLQALFDPFDVNDDRTGVTMGLYLVRALTVLHGGTVGVDQDDAGTAFWVRIPDRPATEEEP